MDSSFERPTGKFKKTSKSINNTMKDVPETGSIPVSPITLTAIAPNKKVVESKTIENNIAGNIGNPPKTNINIIAIDAISINIGI